MPLGTFVIINHYTEILSNIFLTKTSLPSRESQQLHHTKIIASTFLYNQFQSSQLVLRKNPSTLPLDLNPHPSSEKEHWHVP
jgi:hypothetical protein